MAQSVGNLVCIQTEPPELNELRQQTTVLITTSGWLLCWWLSDST